MDKPIPRTPRVLIGNKPYLEPLPDFELNLEIARESGQSQNVEALETYVREANLWLDGEPMPEVNAKRVRARLLNPNAEYERWEYRQPGVRVPEGNERRWLIPGLWPWGTTPLLTGQPKVGKSTLVADLVASLAIPGRKFLGYFEGTSLTPEEMWSGGIILISAEGAPEDYERELIRLGLSARDERQALVNLYHLEAEQLSFDLTDPEVFEEWLIRLPVCDDCDGTDDYSPTVIVVDGITAVLQNAGKGVEHYGQWIAAFRKLQRELGTPNGLIVGHSTLSGGHALGNTEGSAQSDGLWSYSSANPDNPNAERKFKVVPRLGGVAIPPTPVKRVDGRLVLSPRDGSTSRGETSVTASQSRAEPDFKEVMMKFVADHHTSTGQWPSTTDLRSSKVPRERVAEVREQLVEEGRLYQSKLSSPGGGAVFMIPEAEGETASEAQNGSSS